MSRSNFFTGTLIIAAVAVSMLPLFIYFYLYPSFTNLLTENSKEESIRIAKHLSSMFVNEEGETDAISVSSTLKAETAKITNAFRLTKIKIFTSSGEIIYSSDRSEMGKINNKHYFHEIIAKGNTYAQLVKKDTESLEGQLIPVNVLETYVPIIKNGTFVGAFEIYYDITAKKALLDKFLARSSAIIVIITISLLMAVILSAVKARKTVIQRDIAELELRKHHDNLDSLVKERTAELTEINKRLEEEIAERKQAQKDLKESENRFRNLVETTNDWIWEVDNNTVYTYVSPKIWDTLGYKPEEVLGKTPFDLMTLEEADRVRSVFEPVAASRQPFTLLENTCLHKNGHPVVLETSGVPVFDNDGEFKGYRGIDRDITRRKQTENEVKAAALHVQEEKAKLESILDALADAISIQDVNFRILYQNRAHIAMLGDHAGEYCYRAYQGKDRVCEHCHLVMSFHDGKIHTMEQSRSTDNGTLYFEIKSSPLKNSKGEIIAGIEVVRDITVRKKTEALIEQSKKDWESTFDTIEDMITIHDKDFNIVRTNRAAQELHKLPYHEILHTKCYNYYHGAESPPPNCPSCESLRTGFPSTHEFFEPFLNKYIEVSAIPRFDGNNEFSGLIHIVRDITKRKEAESELTRHREHLAEMIREKTADLTSAINLLNDEITSRRHAEEALRVSEKKYRDLYNNAPDMYHTLNKDKIIIDCNETEAKMLGYKKEEIIGRPLSDFFTEESKALLEQDYPRLIEKKSLKNLERTFIRKDGSTFQTILNVFATIDEYGQVTGSRAIARDITDLKRSEKELKNLNRTLKALSDFNYALQHVNDETVLLSETCRIIVNTGSYKMAWVGYAQNNDTKSVRPMAQTGDSDGYLESIDINWDGPDPAKEPAGRAILTGDTCISRNIKMNAHINPWSSLAIERGYNSSIAIPLFENDTVIGSLNIYSGEPDAFDPEEIDLLESLAENLSYGIAVLRSNAERKRAEAEVMRAGHLASLGELAAGVAHEINNPINGIINYAELLIKRGIQDATEQDIAGRIIKEGDRIANIVRSLLSFARDTREEKHPVRIHAILSDTLALTEAQLLKDGIHLQTDFPDNLPFLFAQPQQIEQVFLNLISNARHALNQRYAGEHAGKILNIRGLHIAENQRHYVRIVFYDRGTGIPDDIRDKIMNPFFSTKPSNMGTGLGLSITHGIVSDHNGKIIIESSPGNFTKVIVDIPAHVK